MINTSSTKSQNLIMLKPDLVSQNLILPILLSLNGTYGLNIDELHTVEMKTDQAKQFYLEPHNKRLSEGKMDIDQINEINERNAKFIASGNSVALIVSPKTAIDHDEFIKQTRDIIETLRKSYSSDHPKFGLACNGIHASDSKESFITDLKNLNEFKEKNRDLNNIYSILNNPAVIVPDNQSYNKVFLVGGLNKVLENDSFKANDEIKVSRTILNFGLKPLLINFANHPNVSNALVLKNAMSFLNDVKDDKNLYDLKDKNKESQILAVKENLKVVKNIDDVKNILDKIESQVDNVVLSTIGKNKELYKQLPSNKDFVKEEIEMN